LADSLKVYMRLLALAIRREAENTHSC